MAHTKGHADTAITKVDDAGHACPAFDKASVNSLICVTSVLGSERQRMR